LLFNINFPSNFHDFCFFSISPRHASQLIRLVLTNYRIHADIIFISVGLLLRSLLFSFWTMYIRGKPTKLSVPSVFHSKIATSTKRYLIIITCSGADEVVILLIFVNNSILLTQSQWERCRMGTKCECRRCVGRDSEQFSQRIIRVWWTL